MTDPQAQTAPSFAIERIYVKDLSLENPGAPHSLLQMTDTPQVEVGLRSRGEQIDQNLFECVLTITVTAKAGDKTLFLVEAAQAGVFRILVVGQTEVDNHRLVPPALPLDHDVGRLQVAVDDLLGVCFFHRQCELDHQVRGLVLRPSLSASERRQ